MADLNFSLPRQEHMYSPPISLRVPSSPAPTCLHELISVFRLGPLRLERVINKGLQPLL